MSQTLSPLQLIYQGKRRFQEVVDNGGNHHVTDTGTSKPAVKTGAAGGIWFLGFIGALYYIHTHSGTFWFVILAFLTSLLWPAFVVYHVRQLH